jgi:rod shape-determining protein MreC
MGVISSKGIIGITDRISENYSRVISILNTKLNLNAKLKKSNHFGVLNWNGISNSTIQLVDLPKQTKINIGDTIITGGNSFIFPEGVLIGSVLSFKLDDTQNYIEAEVSLFNDMTNIKNVYVIKNNHLAELMKLNE